MLFHEALRLVTFFIPVNNDNFCCVVPLLYSETELRNYEEA